MAKRRAAPLSGAAIFVLVLIAVVVIAAALYLFASSDCSETETGCRHNEIDIN